MTTFQQWVLTVMAVSVVGTILMALTEKTAGAVVVKAAVSMCLVLTVVSPLQSLRPANWTPSLPQPESAAYTQAADQTAALTAERLGAYLTQYASGLGADCDVHVNYTVSDAREFSVTDVLVFGTGLGDGARDKLTEKIVEELGIGRESVVFYEERDENERNS